MKAQSRPSWSKAATSFLIPACCYHRRKTEPEVSRCQGPALPDFNRFLVTLGRWTHRTSVFSSRTVHFFRLAFGLWRGSFSDHSFHTWDSNHLQLKGFIWHKIQYGCGNTKLQRQRKEKEPRFYLIRNEQEVTNGVTNGYALRESFLMPILLEFPLSVVQGTHLPRFEPSRDAVEMKSMLKEKTQSYMSL